MQISFKITIIQNIAQTNDNLKYHGMGRYKIYSFSFFGKVNNILR